MPILAIPGSLLTFICAKLGLVAVTSIINEQSLLQEPAAN